MRKLVRVTAVVVSFACFLSTGIFAQGNGFTSEDTEGSDFSIERCVSDPLGHGGLLPLKVKVDTFTPGKVPPAPKFIGGSGFVVTPQDEQNESDFVVAITFSWCFTAPFDFPVINALRANQLTFSLTGIPAEIALQNVAKAAFVRFEGIDLSGKKISFARFIAGVVDTSKSVVAELPRDPSLEAQILAFASQLDLSKQKLFELGIVLKQVRFPFHDRQVLESFVTDVKIVADGNLVFNENMEASMPQIFQEYLAFFLVNTEDANFRNGDASFRDKFLFGVCTMWGELDDRDVLGALGQLHDLRAKTDGFNGGDLQDDWIVDPARAGIFYKQLSKVILALEDLL